mgnify:CR=1 FL=1
MSGSVGPGELAAPGGVLPGGEGERFAARPVELGDGAPDGGRDKRGFAVAQRRRVKLDEALFDLGMADHHRRIAGANPVDGHDVPVPHFGVVLDLDRWKALAARLKAGGVSFVIEPYVRFEGETGEQATMFFLDPAGNALEFKAFADIGQLFSRAPSEGERFIAAVELGEAELDRGDFLTHEEVGARVPR